MELLETILTITKCECAEQLKDLPKETKLRIACSLDKRVPSGLATIEEWNELLMYFMGTSPETESKIAKQKLLCFLCDEEYIEEPVAPVKSKWWQFKNK